MEGVENRGAEILDRVPLGVAITNLRFPDVYSLNFLRVEPPDVHATADDLIAAAHAAQSAYGLRHRRVLVNHGPAGARLVAGFRERGWLSDRLVVMALHRPLPPANDLPHVREYGEDEIAEGRRDYYGWQPAPPRGLKKEVVEQLVAARTVTAQAVRVRNFAAESDGRPVSFCDLYSDGTIAQIEDVGTLEPQRKRGLSSAVVRRAIETAVTEGHQLIFLVADADDWPKDFYARLGFDAIGDIYEFTLLPDAAA
ncbi:MAG: hypothetical protein QOH90_841 [Actinomycetota bacterium]|nr:hypothetical protein [Actinomycetota bacterium]